MGDRAAIVLSDDLIFVSRIAGHLRDHDGRAVQVKDAAAVVGEVERLNAACVLLDLHCPGLDVGTLVPELRPLGVRVIGYGSHVDAERLRSARRAGCDAVMPRSQFVEELPRRAGEWLGIC